MDISTSEPSRPAVTRREFTLIIASSFGALLDRYDFYIYAALANIFSMLLFPGNDETTAFAAALATFGAGFLVRPLGACFFGRLVNLAGRQCTFMAIIALMGIAAAGAGLPRSFKRIWTLAPKLFVCGRLLQSVALSGRTWGRNVSANHSHVNRRGFYNGSLQTAAVRGLSVSVAVVSARRSSIFIGHFWFEAGGRLSWFNGCQLYPLFFRGQNWQSRRPFRS